MNWDYGAKLDGRPHIGWENIVEPTFRFFGVVTRIGTRNILRLGVDFAQGYPLFYLVLSGLRRLGLNFSCH